MRSSARSGTISFRPRARILKLIGAELISDEVLAVAELVKNAHDADARKVTVDFRGGTGPDGEIIVTDDGTGMSLETILGPWMEPGGSLKRAKGGLRTAMGRRVLGDKGVGRFAVDKLAERLDVITRVAGNRNEICAFFDWERFADDERMLSSVRNRWNVRRAEEIAEHGTILRMSGLRTRWTERMFRRLSVRLSRLQSPFRSRDQFVIKILSDEFPDYSGEMHAAVLDQAPYKMKAEFDGNQTIKAAIDGTPAENHLWNGTGSLSCGPVRINLYTFDLESDAVARVGPPMEVRAWIKAWSGISVYRDRFRVWPYGEPHDDWLRLDQRRVNNPVVRLSNNQVVGFVDIFRDSNPDLLDQTNREGLIKNKAFEDLRRLMYFTLQLIEAHRQSIRHPSGSNGRKLARKTAEDSSIEMTIARLARKATPQLAGELRAMAKKVTADRRRNEAARRQLRQDYAELAALGQSAVGTSLSMEPLLEDLRSRIAAMRGDSNGNGTRSVRISLRHMDKVLLAIKQRLSMLKPTEENTGQRRRTIDVVSELRTCVSIMEPVLTAHGIRMMLRVPGDSVVRIDMRPANFYRLIQILTNNSIDWSYASPNPEIRITIKALERHCEVLFRDNGPGIPMALAEDIFEQRFSTKEGGRGMGLPLARDIVALHGGSIVVVTDPRRRGATFRIRLTRKLPRVMVPQGR